MTEPYDEDDTLSMGVGELPSGRLTGEEAQLEAVAGRDIGRVFVLGDDNLIGRGGEAAVIARDDGVSRRHARIHRMDQDIWQVEDLGSRNGTFLNGVSVKRARLRFGDFIAVGSQSMFRFSRRDPFEAQRLQAQKLQVLGQLAGGIAHDFNNLLVAVLANVTWLGDQDRFDDDAAREALREVETAARRAVDLTRQLVSFGRAGTIEHKPVPISRVVNDVVRILDRTLPRSIKMDIDVPEEVVARGDHTQLLQVIMNLAVNAADAMPQGGTVRIRARNEEDLSQRGRTMVLLTVEDDGFGMDESTQRRIFEPFFTTKPRGHGTGLGLATVDAVVQKHGGTINVQSEPGIGTRMEVRVPSSHKRVRETVVTPAPLQQRTLRGTVLVVDDEELVRFALGRILRKAGLAVFTANDGTEGLRLFTQNLDRVDLVILDLDMPGLDGRQALRVMRSLDPDIRVVVSSGHVDPDDERDLERDVATFLRKPYDSATLLATLAKYLA